MAKKEAAAAAAAEAEAAGVKPTKQRRISAAADVTEDDKPVLQHITKSPMRRRVPTLHVDDEAGLSGGAKGQ